MVPVMTMPVMVIIINWSDVSSAGVAGDPRRKRRDRCGFGNPTNGREHHP